MFTNPLFAPIFLSMVAAFVATVGLIVVAVRSDWSKKYAHLFAIMASGLLLTMVITHLAPEAILGHPQAPLFMLVGFFGGLLVHDMLRMVLPVTDPRILAAGLTPLLAIALHSFLDGIVYTVTFARGADTGLFATLGLILHEFPEGVIAFSLLRGSGVSNRKSFIFGFLAAAVTTPLGTLAAIPATAGLEQSGLALTFAVSAGLLLFVSTGPLMAHMNEDKPVRTLPALAVGVLVAVIMLQAHNHGGKDDHDHAPAEIHAH